MNTTGSAQCSTRPIVHTSHIDQAAFRPDLLFDLAQYAAVNGLNSEQLCRGLGFSVQDLLEPTCRVSYRQASLMIRRALEFMPVDGLGLMLGQNNLLGSLGLVGHAMQMCKTFGDAIRLQLCFTHLSGTLIRPTLKFEPGLIVMEYEHLFPDPDIQLFLAEETVGTSMAIARQLTQGEFTLTRAEFIHSKPSYVSHYESYLGCPLHFGADQNRAVFSSDWLSFPLRTHHPLGLQQATKILEMVSIENGSINDLCTSVERAISSMLEMGVTLEKVAQSINMSGRTLRRKLSDVGVTYEGLLTNVRKTQSLSMLTHSSMAISDISKKIGYGDVRDFRRAFKRWTGTCPSELHKK